MANGRNRAAIPASARAFISALSEDSDGPTTAQPYSVPPASTATEATCSQRIKTIQASMRMSIQSAYDSRDPPGGNAAVQLFDLRRRDDTRSDRHRPRR